MNKKDREIVFNKFGGRCAYCGCELKKGWHLDHLDPVRRGYNYADKLVMAHPHLDTIENAMPACAKCNINKHSESIEQFRISIARYLESLNLRMVQYQMVKKYGLIQETGIEVKFYFETFNTSQ